jgi:hypothetical protein
LNLGERAEDDGLEDRHAFPRGDLSGDQDDVPDDHREQEVAGALPSV